MEELAIKIKIHDRQYPMKVHAKDEASVRKAADIINKQIKDYREKFKTLDIQDLLTMVAIDCLVDNIKIKKVITKDHEVVNNKLNSLIQIIDGTM